MKAIEQCQTAGRSDASTLTSGYKPSKRHSRHYHNEQALRMIGHILIRQMDAYGKESGDEHDTRYFSCKDVCDTRP